tara:strand:+ start:12473 stop:12832 length:360 start_codon:yes stop_codon:yes gene_type:complete
MNVNLKNKRYMSEGTKHFLLQRISAIINIPLTLFLFVIIFNLPGMSYIEIVASIKNPFIFFLLTVLIINYSLHMKLGMEMIIEDYIHTPKKLAAALILNRLAYSTVIVVSLVSLALIIL